MKTQLAGGKHDGVYVTFRGTAGAEVQGSSARGPDIGFNFHNTGRERERGREIAREGARGDQKSEVKKEERKKEMWKRKK